MCQPQDESGVRIEATPLALKGKLKFRLTALVEEEPILTDTVDVGSERNRSRFLGHLAERAAARGVEIESLDYEGQLLQLAREAELGIHASQAFTGDFAVNPAEVLAAFGMTVLGERDDQSIELWIAATGKATSIKNVSQLKTHEVYQLIGDAAVETLWLGNAKDCPADKFTLFTLQTAIALTAASLPRLADGAMIGQGVWRKEGTLLVVDGDKAWQYDGEAMRELDQPHCGRQVIDLDASRKWHGDIAETVEAMNASRGKRLLMQMLGLLKKWNWTHRWDPGLIAALVLATFVQACWKWRPLLSIIGPSDAGKSTLLSDVLVPLLLDWVIWADRSTEAGLRQAIRHDSAPVIIDEFDQYKHRQQVLELFRTSSRGGKILRGTADQTGQQFGVQHIPWFASIESGDTWGQDRNRFIRVELQLPADRGNLVLPRPEVLNQLGKQVAAAAIWAIGAAVRLANQIKSTRVDGVHGRLVESFSVPAAMFAVLWHGRDATEQQAAGILRRMLANRTCLREQGDPEERRLIAEILATNMRTTMLRDGHHVSSEVSIAQLLMDYEKHKTELAAKGIGVVFRRNDLNAYVFLATEVIRQQLLATTRWKDSRIDQVLARLPNATRTQQRLSGARHSGIMVPMQACLGDDENPDSDLDSANTSE